MMKPTHFVLLLAFAASANALDLSDAVVVSNEPGKAVQVLVEEVAKRSRITLPAGEAVEGRPSIIIERGSGGPAEGYRINTAASSVTVTGNDARGVLFGVGRLLRLLELRRDSIKIGGDTSITSAPETQIRGHQLGYRPKPNTYDGWTLPMWEQYIRDLAIFGTNTIELLPPRTDDDADSPHFDRPQIEMMEDMSRLCDEYDLDVWVWYPALDKDYSDPATVEFAIKEWGDVFRRLPRVDAVFVPGGDPGFTEPSLLFPLLEKQAANLRQYHPKAQMWMAPQSFSAAWMNEFFEIVRKEPEWLSGIVYGPEVRIPMPRFREMLPKKYPIRHYPDITHTRQAQFPVPNWDSAFSLTEARECVNQRPLDMAHIFRLYNPHTIGFITYSEGSNDDVNKIVWSALGWESKADVTGILREYARYFLGPEMEEGFAQGLLALERNWRGPVMANPGIYDTLQQFQAMERAATPQVRANWRFLQGLYRAHYDAYVRARQIHESAAEDRAMEELRKASRIGSLSAMRRAEEILDEAVAVPPAQSWRRRVFELAEGLYQSVRMQLSVERYQGKTVGRGSNLDTIDFPLNSRPWLKEQFREIREIANEPARVERITAITDWTNPGPGGFYDDLGNVARQPHLVVEPGYEADPTFLETPQNGVLAYIARSPAELDRTIETPLPGYGGGMIGPRSWFDLAETLYDAPLKMRYTGLDPDAEYKVRIVYGVERVGPKMQLHADGEYEIHGLIERELRPMEFDLPRAATADGELTLSWTQGPGSRSNGRGNQVAEVWLIRKWAQ